MWLSEIILAIYKENRSHLINKFIKMKKMKYPLNVTIDTNIFVANHFDFSVGSTMNVLENHIRNGKVKLYLSDIVIRETKNHINDQVDKIYKKARESRKKYLEMLPEQYLKDIGMEQYILIPNKELMHQKANMIFEEFLKKCDVKQLYAKDLNVEGIIDNYFNYSPPFEKNEKKRKEFPDAFIAEEIKNRFGDNEVVAIISQDKGFKEACGTKSNFIFYSSLGEFFNSINEQDEAYNTAIKLIKDNKNLIIDKINELIDDDCIEVHGLSFDKDGISEGHEYDETSIEECAVSSFDIHTIDDIEQEKVLATLCVHCDISIDCYYKDYDNAPWDSEEKEYVFVEQKHVLEQHNARFGCRIEIHRNSKEVNVLPFKIILGGNSRKSRIEVIDE